MNLQSSNKEYFRARFPALLPGQPKYRSFREVNAPSETRRKTGCNDYAAIGDTSRLCTEKLRDHFFYLRLDFPFEHHGREGQFAG